MEPDIENAEVKQEQKQAQDAAPEVQAEAKAEQDGAAEDEAPSVSDDDIRTRLLKMLEESDLSQVTEKMLRKQLEEQLGVKLADRKQLIREEVLAYLAKQQPADQDAEEEQQQEDEQEEGEQQEEEQEAAAEKPKKKTGWKQIQCLLSEPLAALVGAQTMSRPDVVSKLWEYIKANNLQHPKDKRKIIVDEKLATVFTSPMTMFNMNKQLTKHIFKKDDVYVGDANGGLEEEQPKPRKKGKKQQADSDDEDADDLDDEEEEQPKRKKARSSKAADGEKKLTGYAKPQKVSEELAAVTGEAEMSRGSVVKWLYAYAKEHDLFDPADKRYVLSDEALKSLTGESRFKAFGSNKLFSKHFPKS